MDGWMDGWKYIYTYIYIIYIYILKYHYISIYIYMHERLANRLESEGLHLR